MRTLLKVTIIGAAALIATPSLALTVSASPNRDQAAHLNQSSGSSFGSNLRGSFVDSGRPQGGMSFSGSGGGYQSGTSFNFGGVSASTQVYRDDDRFAPRTRMLDDAPATRLDLLEPRASMRIYSDDRGELVPRRR